MHIVHTRFAFDVRRRILKVTKDIGEITDVLCRLLPPLYVRNLHRFSVIYRVKVVRTHVCITALGKRHFPCLYGVVFIFGVNDMMGRRGFRIQTGRRILSIIIVVAIRQARTCRDSGFETAAVDGAKLNLARKVHVNVGLTFIILRDGQNVLIRFLRVYRINDYRIVLDPDSSVIEFRGSFLVEIERRNIEVG